MKEFADINIQKYVTPYRYPQAVLHGSGIQGAFDQRAVDIPFVFQHNGQFYMLYTGFDGKGYQSALAVSDDLLHWIHKGVILKRHMDSERWDRVGGAATWILKESNSLWDVPKLQKKDGRYWMVYHSYPDIGYESGPAEIGLAWTEDEELLDWHFLDKPVFSWKDGADWEAGGLYKACMIEEKGVWYLFYNAKDKKECWTEQTGMAYSKDMEHWTRCEDNPILRVTKDSWDERFVSDPYIVKDGDIWLNFYFGYGSLDVDGHSHAQEGLALSSDLIHWEKVKEPVLTHGEPGSIDSGHVHKASILYYCGVLYHFYCATCPWQERYPTNSYGEYRTICVAASKPFKKCTDTGKRD